MAKTVSLQVECSMDPWARYFLAHAWPRFLAYLIFWLMPLDWYLTTKVKVKED